MSDLADFLLARIVEDEGRAHEDLIRPHLGSCTEIVTRGGFDSCDCGYPARVLAECDAKRRIVEKCAPRIEVTSMGDAERQFIPGPPDMHLLGLLALPYADHPDYREEWRP